MSVNLVYQGFAFNQAFTSRSIGTVFRCTRQYNSDLCRRWFTAIFRLSRLVRPLYRGPPTSLWFRCLTKSNLTGILIKSSPLILKYAQGPVPYSWRLAVGLINKYSLTFIRGLQRYLIDELGLNSNQIGTESKNKRVSLIRWSGKNVVSAFYSYFYDGASVWLDRKKKRFDELLGKA